jgi:hypothetical protein
MRFGCWRSHSRSYGSGDFSISEAKRPVNAHNNGDRDDADRLSFLVLYFGATIGESSAKTDAALAVGEFRINERVVSNLAAAGVSQDALNQIVEAKTDDGKHYIYGVKFAPKTDEATGQPVSGQQQLIDAVNKAAPGVGDANKDAILQNAYLFRMSPFWLILAYAVVTLGELMLSPMGLSLVSKVAPIGIRGLMMGGWFVATAIGNKLTQDRHLLGYLAAIVVLPRARVDGLVHGRSPFLLLKPLKKAMPGV